MKKILLTLTTFIVLAATQAMAQFTTAPAFPGAEGYGRFTTGGRGGKVIHVTNLNDSGTGSLRAALNATGNRIVVFDVSGTIALNSRLSISNGNVTVLGQTAPGDGICLKNYPLYISANNVIVRYIRCRMGDEAMVEDDAMSSSHKDNGVCSNIIIDHCSISWSTDECGSFYGNKDFTLQWCMLSESLKNSVHDKGSHGYGGIWGGEKATFHHNMLAHHDSRNPRFDHDYVSSLKGPVDYVNNVVYNWGGNSTYGGESAQGSKSKLFNMQNNYYKAGPATSSKSRLLNPTTNCGNCTGTDVPGMFYINGNYVYGYSSIYSDNLSTSTAFAFDSGMSFATWKPKYAAATSPYKTDEKKFQYDLINMQSATVAFQKVCKWVGCSYKRDAVDSRVAKEAENGSYTYKGSNGSSNGLIDTQSDVGGWPILKTYDKQTDTDNDGMPDAWETANGLNPNDASDASSYSLDKKKWYTNIEVYANSLVEENIKDMTAFAVDGFEEYYPQYTDTENNIHNEGSADKTYGNEPKTDIPTDQTLKEIASGTITWSLTSSTTASTFGQQPVASSDIEAYTLPANATIGSNLIGGAKNTFSSGPDGQQYLVRFKQSVTNTNTDGSNDVVFSVSVKEGYYFKPTKVVIYVNKVGTSYGNTVISVVNKNFAEEVYNGSPSRNNTESGNNNYSLINHEILKPVASDKETKVTVTLFPAENKEMSVGACLITGTIYQLVSTDVQTTPAKENVEFGESYNIGGMKAGKSPRGIIINNGNKYFKK